MVREAIKKTTIVSTLPFILTERKPGMIPGYYEIQRASTKDTLGITHIGDAWYPELIPFSDTKAPPRRVNIFAEEVARGLVEDYISSSLAVSHDELDNGTKRIPGLFWVNGVLSGKEVYEKYFNEVRDARLNTSAWFEGLVKLADDDWQKNHQHKMITDLQRNACSYLGFKDRDWNVNVIEQIMQAAICPSCRTNVVKGAFVCFNCKYILDVEGYQKNKDRYAVA